MKKEHNIKLSYNANIHTHSLKRIVGYYYKDYIELNDNFENLSEDEYSKIMIDKIENAETEKQRDKIAEEYAQNGYFIFLLGDKNHPENIGTISFCGQNSCILDSLDEVLLALENIRNEGMKKLLVIAQTTYSVEKFNNIINVINSVAKNDMEVIVKNTICNATNVRQSETEKISKMVDCMIIIRWKK